MGIRMSMITPAQCRAARGLLDWNQVKLAAEANVGLSTVRGFENGTRFPIHNNATAMQAALERAGIRFTETGVDWRPTI